MTILTFVNALYFIGGICILGGIIYPLVNYKKKKDTSHKALVVFASIFFCVGGLFFVWLGNKVSSHDQDYIGYSIGSEGHARLHREILD